MPSPGSAVAGSGGSLAWALAERPRRIDPLYARTEADRLVARQVHEPLVASVSGPPGSPRRVAGLALSASSARGGLVWRLRLRAGVRFQDEGLLNAQAVLANAARWLAAPALSGIPPGTIADAPAPDLVRFRLPAPAPRFDRVLASPRLGLVSPAALAEAGGGQVGIGEAVSSGTGPFELRERTAEGVVLARNAEWWGTDRGLGPAIDQLEFVVARNSRERLAMLHEGRVQVASELGPGERRAVRSDPLLTTQRASAADVIGLERSVRGIPAGVPVPALNSAWRTRISHR